MIDAIHGTLLRQSTFAIDNGTVLIQWPQPMNPEIVPIVLEWIDLVKRQIGRNSSDQRGESTIAHAEALAGERKVKNADI
jgi:hypothetical protein